MTDQSIAAGFRRIDGRLCDAEDQMSFEVNPSQLTSSLRCSKQSELSLSKLELETNDAICESDIHYTNIECSSSDVSNALPSSPQSPESPQPSKVELSDTKDDTKDIDDLSVENNGSTIKPHPRSARASGVWKEIVNDFDPSQGGDRKILRAIGRTATVNAVVTATAALGPIAAAAGYVTGGAITAKRLVGDGIVQDNPKEVAKSLAVFGSATSASLAGQAITGAIAIGALGATLPVAGALAFGVGCVSGITAGALSEWGVDGVMKNASNDSRDKRQETLGKEKIMDTQEVLSTSHKVTQKPNLINACGAWVNQRRERIRQRRAERESVKNQEIHAQSTASAKSETTHNEAQIVYSFNSRRSKSAGSKSHASGDCVNLKVVG